MANPFVGEILLVPFNFAPKGYTFCQGQILPISQNTALFSLLGTTYGGDGKSTFALPNMEGNIPISVGQGPGLQDYSLGETAGEQNVTLLVSEMPQHSHPVSCSGAPGSTTTPVGGVPARAGTGNTPYAPAGSSLTQGMSAKVAQPNGGGLPHNNMMPSLTLNWIISLQGIFPQRP